MSKPGAPRPAAVAARRLADVADRIGATVTGAGTAEGVQVSGVCLDSRALRPGDLYAALPGAHTHGARFAVDAAASGAVGVLTDPTGAALAAGAGLVVLQVADPRGVLGPLAGWVYGDPAERLLLFGVTGTNGKTTTSHLLDGALHGCGHPRTGLIGTVETRIGTRSFRSARTTPESTDLHALLAVMIEQGATACTMEVSSHALALHRVDGVRFDVVGFTNLSQDHLDFHHDLEEYFAVKASLFTPGRAARGVVCVDDAWGRRLARQAQVPVRTLSTTGTGADWRVEAVSADADGSTFGLLAPDGERVLLRCPIPGRFNVVNGALALAMMAEVGLPLPAAAAALAAAEGVPGRMERVRGPGADGEPVAVVDYAHSPDAVAAALAALGPATRHPLVVVLGAGGDRDSEKRPGMGRAAASGADVVIVTDDNPRSEDPAAIRAAVLAGAREAARGSGSAVLEVGDRRAAVAEAVRRAWGGGTVLLAGKGHERGQEIAGTVHPFDDRAVLGEALAARAAARARPADRGVAR